ncbi:MAG TPA: PD-(D/E)XK nuclease family protein [Polyangiaceae bacterium]|nr:PD-(D/E)XK nuclease family protein [Polyangiaceae bacterium]
MPAARPPNRAKAPRLPRLSPTRLNLYRFCPRAYGFYYDEGLRWGSNSAAQSFGGSLHRALQAFHARGGPEVVTLEALKDQWNAAWSSAGYESPEQAAEFRASGEELLARYHEASREPGRVTLATEATLQRHYDEFILFGKVDRLDRRPDGALEVIDYKSGRREVTEREVRESLAMTLYQLIVARQHPGVPVHTRIVALRTGESASVLRSDAELDAAEADIVALVRTVLGDAIKPALPGESCRSCLYPRVCPPGRAWLREHPAP